MSLKAVDMAYNLLLNTKKECHLKIMDQHQ